MMSTQLIRDIADRAAYQAASKGKTPLVPFDNIERDLPHVPFLGDYVPAGWRHATWADLPMKPRNRGIDRPEEVARFMVDASGWGAPDEPALTFPQLVDYVTGILADDQETTFGFAIEEQGQFQIVMGVYVQDESVTEETGVPDPAGLGDGKCDPSDGEDHTFDEECWCRGDEDEYVSRCPACGDPIDYCQGHGEIGDPEGYAILQAHDDGNHLGCHPDGCPDWVCANCGADASTPHWGGCPDRP